MHISPTDDPQDPLAAHLPDGYPWDHDAPPSTEPARHPEFATRLPEEHAQYDGDDPIPSMRGDRLRDALEGVVLDMADDADLDHHEAASSDRVAL